MVFLQPGPQGRPVAVSRPRAPRSSLRKAAILNLARKNGWTVPSPDLPQSRPESVNLEDIRGEADDLVAKRMQASTRPPRPSPLGLSNYQELDQWHGYHDDFDEGDAGGVYAQDDEDGDELYSDFNFLDTASTGSMEEDDEDYDDAFTVLPSDLPRRKSAENGVGHAERPPGTNYNPNLSLAHGPGRVCC